MGVFRTLIFVAPPSSTTFTMADRSTQDTDKPPTAARELDFRQPDSDDDEDNEETSVPLISAHTPTEEQISAWRSENKYIDEQMAASDLVLFNPVACAQAYKDDGPLGLFFQFIPRGFIDRFMLKATQEELASKDGNSGKKIVLTPKLFRCVIGLDIALSLCNSTSIKELWSSKMFLGSLSFSNSMARDTFTTVRGSLKVYSTSTCRNMEDPLWQVRPLLGHVLRNFASVGYVVGPVALDEASCPTKARTKASSYLPSKPDKFAIRFYALVGWKSVYTFALWDNGTGNGLNQTPAERFMKVFGELWSSFNQFSQACKSRMRNACPVAFDSASMLWVLMIGLLYRSIAGAASHRRSNDSQVHTVVYMDNYYTRHALARACSDFTDNSMKVTGTVKMNLVDKVNKPSVIQATKDLEKLPRGSWILVQVYTAVIHPDSKIQKEKEKKDGYSKSLPRAKVGFNESDILEVANEYCIVAKRCGFIVFHDKKPVVFYTNDLADTPQTLFGDKSDEHAVRCVHGLATLFRWTGDSYHAKQSFKVPAPVVAYNLFMNGVDRADQMRSTNACRRKEKHLHMTIWHFVVDLCILNAFQVYLKLRNSQLIDAKKQGTEEEEIRMAKEMPLREFKRKVCVALCMPYAETYNATKKTNSKAGPQVASAENVQAKLPPRPPARYKTPPVRGRKLRRSTSSTRKSARFEVDLEADTPGGASEVTKASEASTETEKTVQPLRFETNLSHHILQPNPVNHGRRHRSTCYLCSIIGTGGTHPVTSYGCVQCQRCFHPECFSLYHNSWKVAFCNDRCKEIRDLLEGFWTANPHVLEYNMEGEDTPTKEDVEEYEIQQGKKGICAKEEDIRKFGE